MFATKMTTPANRLAGKTGRATVPAARRMHIVRAEVPEGSKPVVQSFEETAPVPAVAANFQLLNQTTEALNGRSAMIGFVAAVIAESTTHQSVWSQVAGKYVDMDLVEKPLGVAALGFGAVVALVTMATLMPKLIDGAEVNSKSFGPFTPALESRVGRVAMMGFLGLLVVELAKGSSLL